MKSEDDRDRAVERLLRQSSAGAMGLLRQDHCLDAEIAAAWVDGNLLPHERAAVESHVSECARCQAIVATLARTTPAGPTAAPWWQRQWRWGWLVPLTAGAAAIIMWVVTSNEALGPPSEPLDLGAQTATQALKQEPAAFADRFDQQAPSNEERAAAAPTSSQAREKAASGAGRSDEANAALMSRNAVPGAIEVLSPDPAIRWRMSESGAVERSLDGGRTWEAQATGTNVALAAGASPSPSVCWVVGRAGTILLTTDGRGWQRVPFPEPADLVAVQAADARTATVSAGDGRRFRTTDGGTTWVPLPLQEF